MPFTGKVGDTLYLSDSGGGHRYVIISARNAHAQVVLVNFTSTRLWKDNTAVFRPRDDENLFEVETSVRFSDATFVSVHELVKQAHSGLNTSTYRFCSEKNVKRIIQGAFQSDFTPFEIIEELKTQYPADYSRYYTG